MSQRYPTDPEFCRNNAITAAKEIDRLETVVEELRFALQEIAEANGTSEAPKHVSRSALIEVARKALG